jgi:very-short-patch-repair endonuclease
LKKGLTLIARALRNNPTEAEKYLWYVLRVKNLGDKFRRQTVIGRYVVDFVCFEKRLIVEVDGGQHGEIDRDRVRDQWLNGQGFEILRFWNHDVLGNRDSIRQRIVDCLNTPSLTLPTRGREVISSKLPTRGRGKNYFIKTLCPQRR